LLALAGAAAARLVFTGVLVFFSVWRRVVIIIPF
jgi:hypothetical protein